MSTRAPRSGFARRPADPETWVRAAKEQPAGRADGAANTARLTIDVTPAQRGRIKIVAFERGMTVADMLRALLEREFPPAGDAGQ